MRRNWKENRPVAYCVLAVVIVLCLLLSGGGRLAAQARSLTDTFFSAGESISADLSEQADNAHVMADIAARYEAVDGALPEAVEEAVQALRTALSGRDIPACHEASVRLTDAVESLYTAGSHAEMQGSDGDDFRYKYKNFTSAGLRIAHSEYHDMAEQFNRTRRGFPASMICAVRGIGEAAPFAAAAQTEG